MSPAIANPKAAISDALDQAEKRGSLDIAKAIAANRKKLARLEEVEDRIGELEAALEKWGKELSDPPDNPDQVAALGHKYREAETELEILLDEWETLQK